MKETRFLEFQVPLVVAFGRARPNGFACLKGPEGQMFPTAAVEVAGHLMLDKLKVHLTKLGATSTMSRGAVIPLQFCSLLPFRLTYVINLVNTFPKSFPYS